MKNTVTGLLLFGLLGLTGGYHLMRYPLASSGEHALEVQATPEMENVPEAADWGPLDSSPTEKSKAGDQGEVQLKMVSSVDSLSLSSVENRAERCEQQFTVMGLNAKSCDVYVAVFESESGFPNSELSNETIVVSNSGQQVQFSLQLPTNRPVAIAVFQDIDGDGKLTKSQLGIPSEPYGFSNNARGMFGPPSFKQAAFVLSPSTDNSKPIEIKVR
jgi:uncharacterized protein (DUF2141 family)